jgi:hypothetical protein
MSGDEIVRAAREEIEAACRCVPWNKGRTGKLGTCKEMKEHNRAAFRQPSGGGYRKNATK